MNILSYFLGSRALTEEEEENIRLQIGRCDSMINQVTRNLADEQAHLVLPANINGGDWGEYKKSMKYIKNLEESATYVCPTCFY